MRILLVEDDAGLAGGLRSALVDERYAVDWAGGVEEAAEFAAVHPYDLAVLDWSLPDGSGIDLLARWRRQGLDLPVLLLTGKTRVEDRVLGLDTGADDYLTKPFALAEFLARVRSLARRRARPLPALRLGDLALDRARHSVTVAGEACLLTPKEFGVLEYLLSRRDEVVSREELGEHVWDRNFDPSSNTIDVIVYRLRKKIDGDRERKLLHTVPGAGYVLRSPAEVSSSGGSRGAAPGGIR